MHSKKGNGLDLAKGQPAETQNQNTNDLDSATGERHGKAESTLIAKLALAGHAVHPCIEGGYTVSKYGYSHYAPDLAALQAFARKLGVGHA